MWKIGKEYLKLKANHGCLELLLIRKSCRKNGENNRFQLIRPGLLSGSN